MSGSIRTRDRLDLSVSRQLVRGKPIFAFEMSLQETAWRYPASRSVALRSKRNDSGMSFTTFEYLWILFIIRVFIEFLVLNEHLLNIRATFLWKLLTVYFLVSGWKVGRIEISERQKFGGKNSTSRSGAIFAVRRRQIFDRPKRRSKCRSKRRTNCRSKRRWNRRFETRRLDSAHVGGNEDRRGCC